MRRREFLYWLAGGTVGLFEAVRGGDDARGSDARSLSLRDLASPLGESPLVLLVLIDTLRRDHVGAYGYSRPTTPTIDDLAKAAVVFDQARAPAPWTLPSVRSLLTGHYPENAAAAVTLQTALQTAGWKTGMMASNAYTLDKQIKRGWTDFRYFDKARAEVQVDRAIQWLSKEKTGPRLLVVHFMDVHLPYNSPEPWRSAFVKEHVKDLAGSVTRPEVLAADLPPGHPGRQYIADRYDGSLRYIDAHLARLLDAAGPGAIVVACADHGEEFWDHGGFEHGHTLYEELLHVPLIMRIPGVKAQRSAVPVSLLDVTPTLLDLTGVTGAPTGGVSLGPLMSGAGSAAAKVRDRDHLLGYTMHSPLTWGVYSRGVKYSTTLGVEQAFDLDRDPAERVNQLAGKKWAQTARYRERTGRELGRPLEIGFSLMLQQRSSARSSDFHPRVRLVLPAGWRDAFTANEEVTKTEADIVVDGPAVTVTYRNIQPRPHELVALPRSPFESAIGAITLQVDEGHGFAPVSVAFDPQRVAEGHVREPIVRLSLHDELDIRLDPVVMAARGNTAEPEPLDREQLERLRSLGYVGGRAK